MSPSYRERYRPSPHLPGAAVGAFALLTPALSTWGGWTSPMPTWLVVLLGAAGLGLAARATALLLRCHTALLADANGLHLRTAGGPRRSERLTLPWAQVKVIKFGEHDAVLHLEVVPERGAPPVPAAFGRAAVTPTADGDPAGHFLLPIRDWTPDRAQLAAYVRAIAPGSRVDKRVPESLARMVIDRQLDRTDFLTNVSPGSLRYSLQYLGGAAACLLLGVSLLGFWADLSAHLGHGRIGVWTAGPESCSKKDHTCVVRGEFVPDDGGRPRGGLSLHNDDTLYPAGYQVRVRDTGSLDDVYLPDDPVTAWRGSLAAAVAAAVPFGGWLWLVPIRAARRGRIRHSRTDPERRRKTFGRGILRKGPEEFPGLSDEPTKTLTGDSVRRDSPRMRIPHRRNR